MGDLRGARVLITGASTGIGAAAARRLASEGARLALVARRRDKLQALAADLGAVAIPADLAVPGEAARVVAEAEAALAGIDLLFANAGVYLPGDLIDADPEAIDQLININVTAVMRAVRAALPGMIARGQGDIIVTSSVSGHQAIQWEPVYSASKHAVQAFVHGLRRQVGRHDIRVGALAPGVVLTPLWGEVDAAVEAEKVADRSALTEADVVDAFMFMATRPRNVTIRDLVILPATQDI